MASSILVIKQALIQQWSDNFTEVPTEYDNNVFNGDRTQPFVQFYVAFGKSISRMEGTGTTTRHTGTVRIHIRVPLLSGSNTAYDLATKGAAAMERQRFGTVTTRQAQVNEGPDSAEYYSIILTIPFVDS